MSASQVSISPRKNQDSTSPEKTKRQIWPEVKDFVFHVLGQARIYNKLYAGIMHGLLFWGVTTQIFGTIINLMQMQLFLPFIELSFPRGNAYLVYELIMDIAGGAILVGVLMAAFRRFIIRPKTLRTQWDDIYALILLALIPLVGFSLEGAKLLAVEPEWSGWSPIGNIIANLFNALGMVPETAVSLHPILFWTHMILGMLFIASIPFTKLRHLFATPLHILLHNRRKEGALSLIENIEETELLGAGQINEFTPIQLLSFDACLRCGRCEENCPVYLSGMSYSPCDFIQCLHHETEKVLIFSNGQGSQEILGHSLPEEAPWYCTTCGACLTQCPAFVNPVDAIIDLRRFQTLAKGKPPRSVVNVLRNLEQQGNPWGMPVPEKLDWIDSLGIHQLLPGEQTDVLLFLGCAFAYDDRNKQVAQAFIHLMQNAGIEFAVLGADETCCGDTARRLGNEYLFQMMAEQNIEILEQVKFNRIVTQCPHCFNTLKNEYPQIGGEYQVQHYTQFLAEILPELKFVHDSGNGRTKLLTYHDPCYLRRYNQEHHAPRLLLDTVKMPRLEMTRFGNKTFCCGGGGGQMWMETDADTRINHRRLADALKTQADVVATACPYCLLMFDDAIRSQDLVGKVQVLDIAEVLADYLQG